MLLYKAGKAVPGPKANTMFASLLLPVLFSSPSTCHLSLPSLLLALTKCWKLMRQGKVSDLPKCCQAAADLPQCPPVLAALMPCEGGAVLKRSVLLHEMQCPAHLGVPSSADPTAPSEPASRAKPEHIKSKSPLAASTG